MKRVRVKLEDRSYDILIKNNILAEAAAHFKKLKIGKKIFVIADKNSSKYFAILEKSLKEADYEVNKITLSAGEKLKSFSVLEKLCDKILSHQPDRNSTIVALGGGVIGDLSGLTASLIVRGINFIQIPTTLLSQVDSSVGGKTAVNSKYGKNLIGSFYQPRLVLIDPTTLKSLPQREFLCGYVEAVKYALINDAKFFTYLENNKAKIKKRDLEILQEVIQTSCTAKANIVSQDEKEAGCRALLNLGHTFGHAFEKLTGYSEKLKHGEAVALGTILAAKISEQLGHTKNLSKEIEEHYHYFNIPVDASVYLKEKNLDKIISYMTSDKKVIDNKIVLILLKGLGQAFIAKDVSKQEIKQFFKSQIK